MRDGRHTRRWRTRPRAVGLAAGRRASKIVEDVWSAFGVVEVHQPLVEHAGELATWDRRLHGAATKHGLELLARDLG